MDTTGRGRRVERARFDVVLRLRAFPDLVT